MQKMIINEDIFVKVYDRFIELQSYIQHRNVSQTSQRWTIAFVRNHISTKEINTLSRGAAGSPLKVICVYEGCAQQTLSIRWIVMPIYFNMDDPSSLKVWIGH